MKPNKYKYKEEGPYSPEHILERNLIEEDTNSLIGTSVHCKALVLLFHAFKLDTLKELTIIFFLFTESVKSIFVTIAIHFQWSGYNVKSTHVFGFYRVWIEVIAEENLDFIPQIALHCFSDFTFNVRFI